MALRSRAILIEQLLLGLVDTVGLHCFACRFCGICTHDSLPSSSQPLHKPSYSESHVGKWVCCYLIAKFCPKPTQFTVNTHLIPHGIASKLSTLCDTFKHTLPNRSIRVLIKTILNSPPDSICRAVYKVKSPHERLTQGRPILSFRFWYGLPRNC